MWLRANSTKLSENYTLTLAKYMISKTTTERWDKCFILIPMTKNLLCYQFFIIWPNIVCFLSIEKEKRTKNLTLYFLKFLLVSNEILDQCSCVCVRLVSLFPEVCRNSLYWLDQSRKDEKLRWLWRQPVVST